MMMIMIMIMIMMTMTMTMMWDAGDAGNADTDFFVAGKDFFAGAKNCAVYGIYPGYQ